TQRPDAALDQPGSCGEESPYGLGRFRFRRRKRPLAASLPAAHRL
ncbi:uncharacterized protein METZ01_LOCUS250514, partial [marine metagenome]